MSIYVLSTGISNANDLGTLGALPFFRKATRNMMLAYSAIAALDPLYSKEWLSRPPRPLALVLGTSHGELDSTIQFLKGLGMNGVARPFLFQNSLHNATLGFLSLQLGISGPGFTVSSRFFSGEDSLELASDLLEAGMVDYALALGVDGIVPGFESALTGTYPGSIDLSEGAGAVLLANTTGIEALSGRTPLCRLDSLTFERRSLEVSYVKDISLREHYDSNAVGKFALAVREGKTHQLRIPKPDGSEALIRQAGAVSI